jgi:DNA-binding response OmpR family regulator
MDQQAPAPVPRHSINSGKLVIAVDDDTTNIAILESAIAGAGYPFLGATSGFECIELLKRYSPNLLLLDIEMPDFDGFDVCRHIRCNPYVTQMPIAFLTQRRHEEDVRRCIELGGNDFIVKPFDLPMLLGRVRYWTRRRPGSFGLGDNAA